MAKKFSLPPVSSIQARLGITFLAFLVLLLVSVSLTFAGIKTQDYDARIINLAGRQRMLLQQMASLSIVLRWEDMRSGWYARLLADTIADFDQTLAVMQSGGEIVDYTGAPLALRRSTDPDLSSALHNLSVEWVAYRQAIDPSSPSGASNLNGGGAQGIQEQSSAIVAIADQVVQSYETITQRKLSRLRMYQLGFLVAGLVVLGAGWWITRKSVVLPLSRLAQDARGIGEGRLVTAIQASGPDEVRSLGLTMDEMRQQLSTSQKSLQQWAETLEARVDQRTRELEALAAVNREIASHLAISDVLSTVTKKVRQLSGADVASLCLLDPEGKVLTLQSVDGLQDSVVRMNSSAVHPMIGRVLQTSCLHPGELQGCEGACQVLERKYLASHLAVSIKSNTRVIGVLCIGSTTGSAFGTETRRTLAQLVEVAAIALENSRLYQQVESLATLEERQRIASEMHDGSLQTLSFLRMMVVWAREHVAAGEQEKALMYLDQVERAQDQADQEIRRAIASLEDRFPVDYTLQEQLVSITRELSREGNPVEYRSEVVIPLVLSPHESEQALRIVREAVANAQKHSRSDRIQVVLSFDEKLQQICLKVKDFGAGFDAQSPAADGRVHFGLKIMRARAARLGGEVCIQSARDQGTEVTLSWQPASFTYRAGEGE